MGLFEELSSLPSIGGGFMNSIVTGTVKENYHKDFPGKIRVELFLSENGKNLTGWIPVMSPYAGQDYGYYSLPEVGAEVVVGFNMGDRNRPIVLGTLWNEKNKHPKDSVTEKNTSKMLITKGGNEILIDDTQDKQKITLKTKSGLILSLDDEKKSLSISDKEQKNSILIDSSKGTVTITADKKLILKAGGKDVLTADGTSKKLTLKSADIVQNADKGLEFKGQSLKMDGSMIKINGSGSAQVSSGGSTQIKGAIVKIN